MNSQDLRNLQEAYLGLYEEETNSMRLPGETKKQYEKSKKRNRELLDAKKRERENRARNQNPLFIGRNGKITKTQREQVDIYDIILSHLLDEGYAETPEAAEALMVNMSEEWLQSIMEVTGGAIRSDVPQPGRTNVIRADVPQPGTRRVSMTATGQQPPGERLANQAKEAIQRALGGISRVGVTRAPEPRKPLISTPAPEPRKPLISTTKPGPQNNYGRGF